MSPRRIAAVTAAFVSVALFSVASAQAATHHARHHHPQAAEVAAEGAVPTSAITTGGYYQPSAWGDFECVPSYPGCRPYAAKDWSKP